MTGAGEWTFKLKEVSAFDLTEQAREFAEGQRAICGASPDPNVRVYPRFTSQQPLYGRVSFADRTAEPAPRTTYRLALDESKGTGQGYDRLYFDRNQDGDLTNDKVLPARANPAPGATLNYTGISQVCFENLAVPLAFGSQGERLLEMMPRLLLWQEGDKGITFVTTQARQGRIRLAGGKYDVLLGHNQVAAGWFDHPWTALHLMPAGSRSRPRWMGSNRLMALHKIDGTFYQFAATPAGDKLTVRPYTEPLGVFEVGAGARTIEGVNIHGSLRTRNTTVGVGEVSRDYRLSLAHSPVQTCELPADDYMPEYLTLEFGKLRMTISNNYHTDGRRMHIVGRQWVYGIHIRPDQPFVLDFSNPPAVMFVSPARDCRIKPGEELRVMAVLTDPVLDIMFRRLQDTSEQCQETLVEGQPYRSLHTDVSLDPKVVIRRANGEIVAEGVMPFG
ncbi:MAG: hypothetical protein FJ280_14785 [Planctomycetes bacterium]|nr:hypothetical protein [Planctomycetota bacterium]